MRAKRVFRRAPSAIRYLLSVAAGCLIAVIAGLIVYLNNQPDLLVWHTVKLSEEFSVRSRLKSFDEYLALEDRLFKQLDDLVYAQVAEGPENAVNRFSRDSLSDPGRLADNWNRSFALNHDDSVAGVLLLHGLSDSPYTMKALGESMHQQGASVLALRIPGHGTAPSGLVDVRWQDMAAAVRLAARHMAEALGDKPLYVVGYSNGGALAIEYTLATLFDDSLPRISGVVLLSPEIGVSGAAAMAVWQGRLGRLLGLDKLAWNAVVPEYDPFKYGSFAINAADLAHRITVHIQDQLDKLRDSGSLERIPPILAFQSGVDATVNASALVANLFDRLPAADHELVLFDVNRRVEADILLRNDPRDVFEPLLKRGDRSFAVTIVSNESETGDDVLAYAVRQNEETSFSSTRIGRWPSGVFSLSHVALPFSPSDPVYGGPDANASDGIKLGNLAVKGERGVLYISGNDVIRLRWNPFYDYVENRTLQFLELE